MTRIFVDYSRRPLGDEETIPVSRRDLGHIHVGDVVLTWGDADFVDRKAEVLAITDLPGAAATLRLRFLDPVSHTA
jgi:hypothetical protein